MRISFIKLIIYFQIHLLSLNPVLSATAGFTVAIMYVSHEHNCSVNIFSTYCWGSKESKKLTPPSHLSSGSIHESDKKSEATGRKNTPFITDKSDEG